ncbi:MAG: 4Fe-4S dicluster domain-containing protein [Actinomycetota bacterium]|nr:4Fe-4S dicluster domain-containing protein [Actinomycetota bacterium]
MAQLRVGDSVTVLADGLDRLVAALAALGYATVGPTVRDGAIVPGAIGAASDLPRGWHDEQSPGSYRVRHDDGDGELFGWAVGPASYKGELFPSEQTVWRARREDGEVVLEDGRDTDRPLAIVGARPCELAGLEVLDSVLLGGPVRDRRYGDRRAGTFVVVAECGRPSGACFCTSMGTGPSAGPAEPAGVAHVGGAPGGAEGAGETRGRRFDLAMAEVGATVPVDARDVEHRGHASTRGEARSGAHRLVVTVGSERGASLLEHVPHVRSSATDRAARAEVLAAAAARMGRSLDTDGLAALLARNLSNPRWDEVAERCLSCGNCTMVCPTCFCTDVDDVSDVRGGLERTRRWSSCFDLAHSYVHGGPVRSSAASRYRQWATHKLSTWFDQFHTSGCVGCGRCIAWCPVGIDITEEAAAIRATDGVQARAAAPRGKP